MIILKKCVCTSYQFLRKITCWFVSSWNITSSSVLPLNIIIRSILCNLDKIEKQQFKPGNRRRSQFQILFFLLLGRLVVRQLPRQQPERVGDGGPASQLRGRHQLVHVDRLQLLPQEDRHENEAADQTARWWVVWRGRVLFHGFSRRSVRVNLDLAKAENCWLK